MSEVRQRGPRPLDFIRIRLHRGGQAEYARELFAGAQEFWYKRLGELRDAGADENGEDVEFARQRLVWLIDILRDLDSGIVELVGKDGY